jgi:hypothetical protein
MSEKSVGSEPNEFEVRNMIRNHINSDFFLDLSEFVDDEEEWTDIDKIKSRKKQPTFDELFNKLAELGLESLTKEELQILNKLSN